MSAEDFKTKAAACMGGCDVYELCVTYLRRQAKSDDEPVALKAMDIFEEIMG
jgi:hypothetical protein